MGKINLHYLCKAMGNLSGMPVRLYEAGKLVAFYSVVQLPRDPMTPYMHEIEQIRSHVGYFVTPRFLCYGVLNAGESRIVVGPTAQVLPSDQALRELAFQADVPREETQAFVDGLKAIVRMPLESMLTMLCTFNHVMNGEELELNDLAIHEPRQAQLKTSVEHRRTEKRYEQEAESTIHNTLSIEQTLMDLVRRGDTAALRQWIAQAPPVRGGVLAEDQLRQLKNTFIVTTTLASRAAIRGGLDAETALSLSDAYIRHAELIKDQSGIMNLQVHMLMEFAEQVERVRHGAQPTKLALEVANYVQRHLSEPISTEAMAKEFYLSRTHFSARFKRETGETLTAFILREKMEEAKRLLRYTDKSSSAIGSYLGYSSQSHFSRVFKQYTGLTPSEYREKTAI